MTEDTSPAKENTSLALSGMIIGLVGLFCAFLPGWHKFGLIAAAFAVLISIFSLSRSGKTHSKRIRAVVGMIAGIAGIAVGTYFWITHRPLEGPKPSSEAIPVELRDTSAITEDNTEALNKLQNITDSAKAE